MDFACQTIFRNPKEVKPYAVPNPERCNLPAAALHASSESVVIVDKNAPAAHVAQHKWQPNTPDGQGTPFLFHHGKAIGNSSGGTFMRMFKNPTSSGSDEWQFPRALAFATSGIRSSAIVSITCDEEIITGKQSSNICPYLFGLMQFVLSVHFFVHQLLESFGGESI